MTRKSLTELREEMRSVARGERLAAPMPGRKLVPSDTPRMLTPEEVEILREDLREADLPGAERTGRRAGD
jgi:hypothetical protein